MRKPWNVAGGSGNRFGSELPKQYVDLQGVPIFIRSIKAFKAVYSSITIILVIPKDQHTLVEQLLSKHSIQNVQLTTGGSSRYDSVKNGLAIAPQTGIIGVHDAVRPLVSEEVIRTCFETALEKGSAIPVLELENSIRKLGPEKSVSVNRADYKIVQTPQCFKAEWLHDSYSHKKKASFTDDASVVEIANYPIFLVEGNKANIKITTPTDLLIANAFLKQ